MSTMIHEPDNEKLEVSVVIPCLNEAQTLEKCITKAKDCLVRHGINGEIIVVDNGSEDDSVDIVRRCGARLVEQPIRGYGAALRKGFLEASGEYVIMGDADDSYDFSQIDRLVYKLREGFDVVMGTRLKGEIKPGAMPWLHRYIGNPLLTFILNLLFSSGISDAHCGLRAFRRDKLLAMDLRTSGMELASEMVIKATRAGLTMTEIPIVLYPDGRNRPPHLRSFRDGWRHLRFMLMFAPNKLFIIPGSTCCLLGLLVQLAILINGPITIYHIHLAENTMILSMMASSIGLQLLFTGFFAYLFISTDALKDRDARVKMIIRYSKLEKGVIVGALLFLVGLLGDGYILQTWYDTGFGSLELASIRYSIFFSTVLILGIQIIFASFFLNMIGIERATYAGDWR